MCVCVCVCVCVYSVCDLCVMCVLSNRATLMTADLPWPVRSLPLVRDVMCAMCVMCVMCVCVCVCVCVVCVCDRLAQRR